MTQVRPPSRVLRTTLVPRLLTSPPAIREQVVREMYGDAYMDELTRCHAERRAERDHAETGSS